MKSKSILCIVLTLTLILLLSSCSILEKVVSIQKGQTNETAPAATAEIEPEATPEAPPGSKPNPNAGGSLTQRGILSSFTSTDIYGETVDADILTNFDLTMVNVWATFCGPCINEMPELGELAKAYAPRGVQILGLVSDTLAYDGSIDDAQVAFAREIAEATGANYMHIIPSEDLYGILSQIDAVPTTFFVDSDGVQVGEVYVGSRSGSDWAVIIENLLAEVQV